MAQDVSPHHRYAFGKHHIYEGRYMACPKCRTRLKRLKNPVRWVCPTCQRPLLK